MSTTASLELLKNGSATSVAQYWPGGHGVLYVEASFGGGSVGLQCQGPNGSWLPVQSAQSGTDISLAAAGTARFFLAPGPVRATVATATAVHALVARVPS